MMVEVLEPQDARLQQWVDSIYLFRKGTGTLEFTAYPSVNTPVALFRNARIRLAADRIFIRGSEAAGHCAIACNQLFSGVHLSYGQLVDEIAINFKPLGFASFSRLTLAREKLQCIRTWDALLPALFDQVFASDDPRRQLACIEAFLLEQYQPVPQEAVLLNAMALLSDTATDHKMEAIARQLGIHYKQLYRSFTEGVGCSLAHYRNLVKFRASVLSKINSGSDARLVDICYDHGYTDQPYFIRQFRKLTGENPARFFKEINSFGNDKLVFKVR